MLKLYVESVNSVLAVAITYDHLMDTMGVACFRRFFVASSSALSREEDYRFTPTTVDVATLAGCVQSNAIGVMLDYLQERVTDSHGQEVIAKAMEFSCW